MFRFMAAGGTVETEEIQKAKLEICKGCDKFQPVEPIPGIKFKEGCGGCGCPIETKVKYRTLPRLKEDIGKPLTVSELIGIKLNGNKLFNNKAYVDARLTCPHPDGDKWRKQLGSKLD